MWGRERYQVGGFAGRCAAAFVLWAAWVCAVLGAPDPEIDHAAAFAMLGELGLPDVRGGELGRTEAYGLAYRSPFSSSSGHLADLELANAWRMTTLTNGLSEVVDIFGRRVLLSRARGRRFGFKAERSPVPRVFGPWVKLAADRHSAAILAALNRAEWNEHDPDTPILAAGVLLLAAQLHQTGLERKSKGIAKRLLKNYPDPESVLVAAVNILAVTAGDCALTKLLTDGDWVAYAERLDALRRLYGPRWVDYEDAARVAESARNRTAPDFDTLAAAGHPDWALACVRALATEAQPDALLLGSLRESYPAWVLAPPYDETPTNRTALVRLLDGGMASVPVLLAVSESRVPILVSSCRLGGRYYEDDSVKRLAIRMAQRGGDIYHFGPYDDRGEPARPATLGELARHLLRPLCPTDDADAALTEGRRWYEKHRDSARTDLALAYLAKGTSEQKRQALAILLATDSPPLDRIEKAIRDQIGHRELYEVVTLGARYAAGEGTGRGVAFAAELADTLEREISGLRTNSAPAGLFMSGSRGYDTHERQYLRRALKQLRKVGTPKKRSGLREILDGFLKNELAAKAAGHRLSSQLYEAVTRTPRAAAVEMVVNAARRAKTAAGRILAVGWMAWLEGAGRALEGPGQERVERTVAVPHPPWRRPRGAREQDEEKTAGSAVPKELSLDRLRAFWEEMLADTREDETAEGAERFSVRTTAAYTMERLYAGADDKAPDDWAEGRFFLDRRLDAIVAARAQARLAGTELPALPSMAAARAVDCAALEPTLLAARPGTISEIVAKLDPLTLFALGMARTTNVALQARLAAAASHLADVPPGTGLSAGTQLGTNAVHALLGSLREARTTNTICVGILRKTGLAGVTVTRREAVPAPGGYHLDQWRKRYVKRAGARDALLYAVARGPQRGEGRYHRYHQGHSDVAWILPHGAGPERRPTEAELDAQLDESARPDRTRVWHEERFWQAVGGICAATNLPFGAASITLYRLPAGAWLSKEPDEDTDETDMQMIMF